MMINLCAAAPVLCGIYILGALAALFNDLGWIRRPAWIGTFGLVLAAIGLGLGVMLVLMNAYLNWKLANAEIMSRVGSKGTGGTS